MTPVRARARRRPVRERRGGEPPQSVAISASGSLSARLLDLTWRVGVWLSYQNIRGTYEFAITERAHLTNPRHSTNVNSLPE